MGGVLEPGRGAYDDPGGYANGLFLPIAVVSR
jgi:hypothetical protein